MAEDDVVVGESRWPMACAVITAIALTLLVRHSVRASPHPVFPAIESVLLVVLIVGDPGRIDRRARWPRIASTARGVSIVVDLMALQGDKSTTIRGRGRGRGPGPLLADAVRPVLRS